MMMNVYHFQGSGQALFNSGNRSMKRNVISFWDNLDSLISVDFILHRCGLFSEVSELID